MADSKKVALLESVLHKPEIMRILVGALSETIAKYLQQAVSVGKPSFSEDTDASTLAVGGTVKLESDSLSLVLFMGLTEDAFSSLHEVIFGMPPEGVNPETADLASEILNVAFGAMDPKLREIGIRLKSSLPKIFIVPRIAEVLGEAKQPSIRLPFKAGGTQFFIEIFADMPGLEWDFK